MADTIKRITTIAALLGESPSNNDLFQTEGYYAVGDGGGGLYRWKTGDTTQPNYGTVIGK